MKFQPGQSGNPGGVAKEKKEVVALARSMGAEAIYKLQHWMQSDDARASVAAASILLDRGFGKAMQPNEHSGLDGAPLMPTLSVTLTNQQLPVKTIDVDGNSERG